MRNSYHTQQRCALLAFLSAHADEQFTVEQLLTAMGDEAPGRSTVPPYSGIAFAIKKPPLLCVAGLPPALISHYAKGVRFVLRYSVFLSNIAAATQNKDPERQR